jgi:hypothetical protein
MSPEYQHDEYAEEGHPRSPGSQDYEEEHEEDPLDIRPDDDMETLNEKLRQSKLARKRAEEDAKLLSNRIKLLQNEEGKARKKIKETKKRASEIVKTKMRNREIQQKKRMRSEKKMEESARKTQFNRMKKRELDRAVEEKRKEHFNKVREEVADRRAEKREQKEILEIQRQQEVLKATSIKQMIRNQEREAEQKRRYMEAEKRARARQNFE